MKVSELEERLARCEPGADLMLLQRSSGDLQLVAGDVVLVGWRPGAEL